MLTAETDESTETEATYTDKLKSFSLLLIFMSAAGLIYRCVLPGGRLGETAKRVLSVCIMSVLVISLCSLKDIEFFSFTDKAPTADTQTEEVLSLLAKAAEEQIARRVSGIIESFTDIPFEIDFSADISSDGCIDIKRVQVTFEKRPAAVNDISSRLETELGMAPEIRVTKD